MTIYRWSTLVNGQVINPFNRNVDVLNFDDPGTSAASVIVQAVGNAVRFSFGPRAVTLEMPLYATTTGNVTFANGSLLLVGDNLRSTTFDQTGGTLTGGAGNDQLIAGAGGYDLFGMGGNDLLLGGIHDDFLNGGVGSDQMRGGAGDDHYIVDATGDTITELNGQGADEVQSSVSYILSPYVEVLQLTGGAAINGTGNFSDNEIYGNNAANTLVGGAANDYLEGAGGNDMLEGGLGADVMEGGDGFDYAVYVNAAAGVTADLASDVPNTGEALGDEYGGIEGVIGSAFSDRLLGDDPANTLQGRAGNDVLGGGAGNDLLYGDFIVDPIILGSGYRTLAQSATHTSFASALALDNTYSLAADADIANATTVPHTTVNAVGNGAAHYYRLSLSLPAEVTLDIDRTTALDSWVRLMRQIPGAAVPAGSEVAFNDDATLDAGSATVLDSRLIYSAEPGLYYIVVGRFTAPDNLPVGSTYELNVSVNTPGFLAGHDTLDGGEGHDRLISGPGNDALWGGDGNDALLGDAGFDDLHGGAGIDEVHGGDGNDVLAGDAGADMLAGGAGADRYDYNSIFHGLDTIVGFARGSGGDSLDIRDVLVGYTPGTSNINNFVRVSGTTSTTVAVNADGVGSDFVALATLQAVAMTPTLLNEMLVQGNLVAS